jgi:hypothetical protein
VPSTQNATLTTIRMMPSVHRIDADSTFRPSGRPPTNTTEGLDAAREIGKELPATGVLCCRLTPRSSRAMELLATGQRIGYLLKAA